VLSPDEVIAAVQRVLAADQHVRWAYVFGSVARRTAYRDVDVALMPAPTMPAGGVAWGQRIAALEAVVACKIDLVDLSRTDLPLVGPMLLERVVVVDREPAARHTFEADTTSRWLDFKPSYEEFLRVRALAAARRLQGSP
jgi:predicted nucleotidyltransferase